MSQTPSACGTTNCPWDPNTTCRTTRAITTAINAATMANQSWFINVLANTRPASPPPNAPVKTIAKTLAETRPLARDKYSLLILGIVQQCPSHCPPLVNVDESLDLGRDATQGD